MTLLPENIPAELRRLARWVVFRFEERAKENGETETTKVPYQPNGRKAQSTNPGTWVTFEEAMRASGFDGIGFVLGDGITGIDLDHCVTDGVIEEWAQVIIDSFASYTEYSVSGTGIHILIRGQVPDGLKGRRKGAIECYSEGRYFTVSARPVPGTPGAVEERQDELTAFFRRCFPPAEPAKPRAPASRSSLSLSDGELLDKAMNARNGAAFSRLWSGDTSGHNGDDSAADLALCCHLAFYWQCDAGAIDRMFRQSGLYREKWDREDYRERTISKAVASTSETYSPPGIRVLLPETGSKTPDEPHEWTPPVSFADHALPPFPVEVLPDALGGYGAEVAASRQVPVGTASMLILATVAAAGAPICDVRVGLTHREPVNLYVAVVADPGSRKTGVLEDVAFPLREAEREESAAAFAAQAQAKERRAVEEKRIAFLREMAAKDKDAGARDDALRELGTLAAELTEVPALPRRLADDVTPEAAAGLMAGTGGTLALFSAEGGVFGLLAGRYSDGKVNLDLFLKGHAGEEYRVDRKGSPPVFIPRACLTMGLAVQPDVLSSLADTPAFRGRGLLGRFLYSLPESLVGTRLYRNRPVCPEIRHRYNEALRSVLALPPAATEADPGARHSLTIIGTALTLWATFADDVERRQADGGDLCGIRDWASKLAGAVARTAGGMHLIEHAPAGRPWETPISPETVAAAWAVGQYLIPHALAAFGQMGADARMTLARRLLRWVERQDLTEFTLRDCHQAHRSVPSAQDLVPALSLLCERGYLREAAPPPVGSAGGRPKGPSYEVNPLHKTLKTHKTSAEEVVL